MNFLITLFFVLVGGFSVGQANALQASDVRELSSQTTAKNQSAHIKAIIFDCDGTLIDNGIGYFWIGSMHCDVRVMS